MGVGGQHHAPASLPPGKTGYPLCRMLGGPQGRSGRVRKISSPLGFDPRTVQPSESRCTDWAIAAPINTDFSLKNEEMLHRVKEERNILRRIKGRKSNWIGHTLHRNCLRKHAIEGRAEGRVDVA